MFIILVIVNHIFYLLAVVYSHFLDSIVGEAVRNRFCYSNLQN